MKIGNIVLKNNLILAPMAGVSDIGLRTLAIECGADYGVCEMVSAKALLYDNQKTKDLLTVSRKEKIKVAQIFGSSPEVMSKAVQLQSLQKFDIIDINMGCPAPKIVKNGEGSALLKNIPLAEKIIRAVVSATDKPITVKFRIGFAENENVAVEFAKMCERAGASAITVHGRTREQGYSGVVNYDAIKSVKESVNIPVIGNGDVVDIASYKKMLDTGVDAVMIGRGAMGNPDIFSELLGKKHKNKYYYVKKHTKIMLRHYPYRLVNGEMKKHYLWYMKGVKGGAVLRQSIAKNDSIKDTLKIMKKALTNN